MLLVAVVVVAQLWVATVLAQHLVRAVLGLTSPYSLVVLLHFLLVAVAAVRLSELAVQVALALAVQVAQRVRRVLMLPQLVTVRAVAAVLRRPQVRVQMA